MDNVTIDPQNYEVTQGSTIIEFNASFLNKLKEGTHNLLFAFKDKEVNLSLVVNANKPISKDNKTTKLPTTGMFVYTPHLGLSLFVAGCYIFLRQKKKD